MKQIFVPLLLLTLFACSKKSNSSQFNGNWKGTYSGNGDNGEFALIIDANGSVKGAFNSYVFILETYQFIGVVDNKGKITLKFGSATPGGTFMGTLNSTTGSGTWENKMTTPVYSGTWSGQKQ